MPNPEGRVPDPPGKLQLPMASLRNSGTDIPREAIGPIGSNLLFEGGLYSFCEIRK